MAPRKRRATWAYRATAPSERYVRYASRHALLFSAAPTDTHKAHFLAPPVVLAASRRAQSPLDAPAPVTIIDREMIDASASPSCTT